MAELGVRRPANKILAISNTRILLILYSANLTDKTDKPTNMVSSFMHTPTIHSDMHCNGGRVLINLVILILFLSDFIVFYSVLQCF